MFLVRGLMLYLVLSQRQKRAYTFTYYKQVYIIHKDQYVYIQVNSKVSIEQEHFSLVGLERVEMLLLSTVHVLLVR